MKLRRDRAKDDVVIDLTDGADAWWAAADDLVTTAPSYVKEQAPPPPPAPDPWAPETVYSWVRSGPHDPLHEIEPHRILGVERDAPWEEIERARRHLAKAHHPDLASDATPFDIDLRERRMQAVNAAYDDMKQRRQGARVD